MYIATPEYVHLANILGPSPGIAHKVHLLCLTGAQTGGEMYRWFWRGAGRGEMECILVDPQVTVA